MPALNLIIEQLTAEKLEGRCTDWTDFPKPGCFIDFVTTNNNHFYTQIESVSPLPGSDNALHVSLIPVKGSPDTRIKSARQITQLDFFRDHRHSVSPVVPMTLQNIVFDLNKSGHVVYIRPDEDGVHRNIIKSFDAAHYPVVIIDPVGIDLSDIKTREIKIGAESHLSIQEVGVNHFIEWVVEGLPRTIQAHASELLMSLVPPTPDFIPIQYFVSHPLLKDHPLASAIMHQLYDFHKNHLFASHPSRALTLQNVEGVVHLNLSALNSELLPLAYEGILRMAFRHVMTPKTQFILIAPEAQTEYTQEFIHRSNHRVFLISNSSKPWEDSINDRWEETRFFGEEGLEIRGKITDEINLFLPYHGVQAMEPVEGDPGFPAPERDLAQHPVEPLASPAETPAEPLAPVQEEPFQEEAETQLCGSLPPEPPALDVIEKEKTESDVFSTMISGLNDENTTPEDTRLTMKSEPPAWLMDNEDSLSGSEGFNAEDVPTEFQTIEIPFNTDVSTSQGETADASAEMNESENTEFQTIEIPFETSVTEEAEEDATPLLNIELPMFGEVLSPQESLPLVEETSESIQNIELPMFGNVLNPEELPSPLEEILEPVQNIELPMFGEVLSSQTGTENRDEDLLPMLTVEMPTLGESSDLPDMASSEESLFPVSLPQTDTDEGEDALAFLPPLFSEETEGLGDFSIEEETFGLEGIVPDFLQEDTESALPESSTAFPEEVAPGLESPEGTVAETLPEQAESPIPEALTPEGSTDVELDPTAWEALTQFSQETAESVTHADSSEISPSEVDTAADSVDLFDGLDLSLLSSEGPMVAEEAEAEGSEPLVETPLVAELSDAFDLSAMEAIHQGLTDLDLDEQVPEDAIGEAESPDVSEISALDEILQGLDNEEASKISGTESTEPALELPAAEPSPAEAEDASPETPASGGDPGDPEDEIDPALLAVLNQFSMTVEESGLGPMTGDNEEPPMFDLDYFMNKETTAEFEDASAVITVPEQNTEANGAAPEESVLSFNNETATDEPEGVSELSDADPQTIDWEGIAIDWSPIEEQSELPQRVIVSDDIIATAHLPNSEQEHKFVLVDTIDHLAPGEIDMEGTISIVDDSSLLGDDLDFLPQSSDTLWDIDFTSVSEISGEDTGFYRLLQKEIPNITKGLGAISILSNEGTLDIEWDMTTLDMEEGLMANMAPDLLETVHNDIPEADAEKLQLEAEVELGTTTVYEKVAVEDSGNSDALDYLQDLIAPTVIDHLDDSPNGISMGASRVAMDENDSPPEGAWLLELGDGSAETESDNQMISLPDFVLDVATGGNASTASEGSGGSWELSMGPSKDDPDELEISMRPPNAYEETEEQDYNLSAPGMSFYEESEKSGEESMTPEDLPMFTLDEGVLTDTSPPPGEASVLGKEDDAEQSFEDMIRAAQGMDLGTATSPEESILAEGSDLNLSLENPADEFRFLQDLPEGIGEEAHVASDAFSLESLSGDDTGEFSLDAGLSDESMLNFSLESAGEEAPAASVESLLAQVEAMQNLDMGALGKPEEELPKTNLGASVPEDPDAAAALDFIFGDNQGDNGLDLALNLDFQEAEPVNNLAVQLDDDIPAFSLDLEPDLHDSAPPLEKRITMDVAGGGLQIYKSSAEASPSGYHPGQQVFHKRYGQGTIKRVITMDEQQIILNINFEGVGKRLLDPNLTQLEKVS